MKHWVERAVACVLFVSLLVPIGLADNEGSVEGRVMNAGGQPVSDAVIELVGHPARWKSDESGAFEASIPPGAQRLMITSARYGMAIAPVNVEPGRTATIEVRLSPVYRDEVVVSAGGDARPVSEVAQPIAVLSGERLESMQQPSLGATIAGAPGVATTSFGPAVGRPILRGLGNDRVRVLSNGTDVGDLSAGAPDHAVDLDTSSADRIEILRGAATLLYGSSAGGGVVNVIDGRIPESAVGRALTGEVTAALGTAARERHGSARAEGSSGAFGWYAAGFKRQSDDYDIPGFASIDPPPDETPGTLKNSGIDSQNGVLGASWIGANGFIGVAVARNEATYGLPGNLEEESEGGDPHIVLQQNRQDVRAELRPSGSWLEAIRLNLGVNDYVHKEAEGGLFGQRNSQKSYEGRLEVRHRDIGAVSGSAGVQLRHREVAIVGDEAFVPPSTIDNSAVFALEELARGTQRWQAGLRYERQEIEGEAERAPRRMYDALSSSIGYVWTPRGAYSVAISVARAVKFPSAEELYTEGPHLSTHSFEIGDADLDTEVNLDTDISIRKLTGRVTGELNLFVNRFDNFIFLRRTDEPEIEELPVLRYENADATFRGVELRVNVLLLEESTRHLSAEFGVDVVRAELQESREPLPRIPPLELGAGLRFDQGPFWTEVAVRRASRQDRLAPFETPTDGYTTFDASAGWRVYTRQIAHEFVLRGTNLNNVEIRNHASFLKDLAPQPGRDVELSYRIAF
jgi:iron complex outermembrane receptor protein